jgi:hypothetical protein
MLLLSGLVLLGMFCFLFLNPVQTTGSTFQGNSDLSILRSPLRVGQSMEDVVGNWGRYSLLLSIILNPNVDSMGFGNKALQQHNGCQPPVSRVG